MYYVLNTGSSRTSTILTIYLYLLQVIAYPTATYVTTYVTIHVIDKHLYISCESEKRTCLLRKMTNVNTQFVSSAHL